MLVPGAWLWRHHQRWGLLIFALVEFDAARLVLMRRGARTAKTRAVDIGTLLWFCVIFNGLSKWLKYKSFLQ